MKDRHYKCPVCGAPVEGEKCEYCGCVIYDFALISTDQPTYLRMRLRNSADGRDYIRNPADERDYILQIKAVAVNPCVEVRQDEVQAVDICGNTVDTFIRNKTCTISVDFQAVADDKGVLFTLIDAERPYRESWRDDVGNGMEGTT